jgi:hypothetical protein
MMDSMLIHVCSNAGRTSVKWQLLLLRTRLFGVWDKRKLIFHCVCPCFFVFKTFSCISSTNNNKKIFFFFNKKLLTTKTNVEHKELAEIPVDMGGSGVHFPYL